MASRVDDFLGVLLGLGVHSRLLHGVARHVEGHARQHSVDGRLADTARRLQFGGRADQRSRFLHVLDDLQVNVARAALRRLHALAVAVFGDAEDQRDVVEPDDQQEVVVGPQKERLPVDVVAGGFVELRLVDVFDEHVGPADSVVEVAPEGEDLGVGGRNVVVAHRTVVRGVAFVTDVGRQPHAAQQVAAVERRVGQRGIDPVERRVHFGFVVVVVRRGDEILRLGVQQAARGQEQYAEA